MEKIVIDIKFPNPAKFNACCYSRVDYGIPWLFSALYVGWFKLVLARWLHEICRIVKLSDCTEL